MLGFLVGAVIWGLTYQQVFPVISEFGNLGNVVIPDLWNLSAFLFILLFTLVSLLLFYLIDQAGMKRTEKSE